MSAPLVLAIDASTYAGSAALIRGSAVVGECTVAMRGEREERLMPAIAEMVDQAGERISSVESLACGAGPGSFTSLRIAASIAKGLAVSLGRPLFAVPSQLLVVTGATPPLAAGRYVVLMDAMRGELYAVVAEGDGNGAGRLVSETEIIPAAHADRYCAAARAKPVGPGVGAKLVPHARGVAGLLAADVGDMLSRVDIDLWEPGYGRLAEAQVRWEAAHGRALSAG